MSSGDSIKKIIQFNGQGIIDSSQEEKCPKITQKVSKLDKTGSF